MKMQDRIMQRQNSDDMLRCQYAARYFFNRGERILLAALILSVINVFFASLPLSGNTFIQRVVQITPIVLGLFTVFLLLWLDRAVHNASELRNYFDETVLSIDAHSFSYDNRTLRTLIDRAIRRNEKEAQVQVKNNAYANPPGVKDWYMFIKEYQDEEAVFECQRQNQWWNKKMLHRRLAVSITCFLILLAVAIILCVYSKVSIFNIIISFLVAIGAFIDRIIVYCKYISLSIRIDIFFESMKNDRTPQQIQQLQELIASRRRIPVLEMSVIHKREAATLSDQYKRIAKE